MLVCTNPCSGRAPAQTLTRVRNTLDNQVLYDGVAFHMMTLARVMGRVRGSTGTTLGRGATRAIGISAPRTLSTEASNGATHHIACPHGAHGHPHDVL